MEYGIPQYRFWILEEEQFTQAEEIMHKVQAAPLPYTPLTSVTLAMPNKTQASLNSFLILICIFCFIVTLFTTPHFEGSAPPFGSLMMSPLNQTLLYDFPKAYALLSELVDTYGMEKLDHAQQLPLNGQRALQQFMDTPFWQGIYTPLVTYLQGGDSKWEAPLFEKIREGEVWRLITPIFLHADILHILFNMMWLYILGRQIELRAGPIRYLALVALAAVFSNTAQYLMSGPNFIGFSGVIATFLTYIWQRQKIAPWEGYQLQPITFQVIWLFIGGLLALQTVSFFTEIFLNQSFTPRIANTAHVAGALFGVLAGKTSVFINKS